MAEAVESPTPAEIRVQLDRILAHESFSTTERRARLLKFLVTESLKNSTDSLKESVIAAEVFDRGGEHDPKIDSVVRVEMGRLRSRLGEYYAQSGANDPVRIEIPKGSYRPVYTALHPEPSAAEPVQAGRRRMFIVLAIAGAVCALGIAAAVWILRPSKNANLSSVAVLPFLNLTGDPGNDFLGDSVTDQLTGVLAQVKDLRVVARTSAFQFKGKGADVRQIGQALNVAAVMEGSISRTAQDRFSMVVQLIRTSDGFHVWSHNYDYSAPELQNIEYEVAHSSARILLPGQPDGLPYSQFMSAANPEAHDLYLRALYKFRQGTFDSTKAGLDLAHQAIAADPAYPPPYLLSSIIEYTLSQFTLQSAKDAMERGRPALEKAIQLNPRYADAHASYALYLYYSTWDWPKAEAEFRLAEDLGSPAAPSVYGWSLATRGRFKEADQQFERAVELDPLAAGPRLNRAVIWTIEGRFKEALGELQRVFELNPNSIVAHHIGGSIELYRKNCPAAEQHFKAVEKVVPKLSITGIGWILYGSVCGDKAEARKKLEALDAAPPPGTSHSQLASSWAVLGDADHTIADLEKAADEREPQVLYLKIGRLYDPFRADPRFQVLARRLGLN